MTFSVKLKKANLITMGLLMSCVVWAIPGFGATGACTHSTDPCVLTYHNDSARDGVNPNETILNVANINNTSSRSFGRLFTTTNVDGQVYAQPLFMHNVTINSVANKDAVFVATENDSVYVFDADSTVGSNPTPLWHTSLLVTNEAAVPDSALPGKCKNITPQVGVTGTPVIDASKGVLYVVSKLQQTVNGSTTYHQWLNAVNLNDGHARFGGRVEITATNFNPLVQNQRAGLALGPNGHIYISWASHCDSEPTGGFYHGWVMEYMVNSSNMLQRVNVFNDTAGSSGRDGGIWQAGGAPAIDGGGNLFLATGNGTFDVPPAPYPARDLGPDYGVSVLKLSSSLAVLDAFTPQDEHFINLKSNDLDLGSGGVVLINTTSPPEITSAGKDQHIYVMNQTNLGGFAGVNDNCLTMVCNTNIIQDMYPALLQSGCTGTELGNRATPAFFNNVLYSAGSEDSLRAFTLNTSTGAFNTTPAMTSQHVFCYPGASPSVSASGTSNGIVWVLDTTAFGHPGPAVLLAYDATASGTGVAATYASSTNTSDQAPNAVKFAPPTVANGKVFVSGSGALAVYGLCPCAP